MSFRWSSVAVRSPASSPRRHPSRSRAVFSRHERLSATLIDGFFEDVPLTGGFGAVIFSFYSYSYIPESHRRIAALRKAADHLTAGGHILVSYPPVPPPHPTLIRTRARGRRRRSIGLAPRAGRSRDGSRRRLPRIRPRISTRRNRPRGRGCGTSVCLPAGLPGSCRGARADGPVATGVRAWGPDLGSDLDFLVPDAAN